jgi:hypothetical protein
MRSGPVVGPAFAEELTMADDQGKCFLVIGRMTGDQEDTPIVVPCSSHDEAVKSFCEQMWEMEGGITEKVAVEENRHRVCNVSVVYVSDTPIRISTGGA